MDVVKALPLIFLVIGAIIGFSKGVKKMPTHGLAWMLAANIYSLLLKVLQTTLGDSQPALPVIVATVACAIGAVFFFAVAGLLFNSNEKEIGKKDLQKLLVKEDYFRQIELEEMEELERSFEADEDDFERLERKQMKRRKRYQAKMAGKPSRLSRLIAAAVVGVDMVFVGRVVINILVILISAGPLATGKLAPLCELDSYKQILAKAENTALDYLIIGAFMFSVKKGYENGVLSALYYLISSVASITAFAYGFIIPFTAIGAEGGTFAFTAGIVDKIVGIIQPKISGVLPVPIPDETYQILGKALTGLLYSIVLVIALSILTKLLRKFAEISYNSPAFHFFDGSLGIVLGVATCVLIFAAIFFIFLLLQTLGWYSASEKLFEGTHILEVLYNEFSGLAGGWADKVLALLHLK